MNSNLVHDRDSFLIFLRQLSVSLQNPDVGDWENRDLASFLEAMEAWTNDRPQAFPENPWQHAATLLAAAKIYE
ncbi:hypothetical protein GAO09_28645 [Rhizobiales bacterium RZME27]|uniref:DUF7660 domain-containing protein n=1 Tax=Endobacterium cereale TaxID=2663029 RepID=A0A6A8AFW1_9HYPH|nr:hypothetical protein [Endobacterium cereale]MEB2845828.1 hypothetical protein [Endobacterium cereale]MQY50002.1 hypothetical protein [Endobacterium cereale]